MAKKHAQLYYTLLEGISGKWVQRGAYGLTIRIPAHFKLHENSLTRLSWVAPWSSEPWLFDFGPGLARVAGFELVWVGDPVDSLRPEPETRELRIVRPSATAPVRELRVEYEDTFVRLISDQGQTTIPLPLWDKILTDLHARKHSRGFTWVSSQLKVPNPLLAELT